MPSVDAMQLERRRKLYEAMGNQAIAGRPTQMVSGRAVPQGLGENLTRLAQAYMASQGLKGAEEEGAKGRTEATQRVMDAMTGSPQTGGPIRPEMMGEEGYQPLTPAVEPDYEKAAMTAATDPFLQGNQGLQGVTQAMLKAKGVGGADPYFQFLPTAEGYAIGDTRKGTIAEGPGFVRSTDDPRLQADIAGGKETAKLESQLELKPDIKAAEMIAERGAEKVINKPKSEMALTAKNTQLDMLDGLIDKAKKQSGFWTTGFFGQTLSGLGGTPQHDLSATLDTVKANIGFDKLQEMREASPTGGALGQVSEMENKLLQSVWGALQQSQSEDQFDENLEAVRTQVRESWGRINAAYEKDYGEPYFKDGSGSTPEGVDADIWNVMTPEEKALF